MPQGHDQYFTERPSTGSHPRTLRLALPDITVELSTDRGVFSPQHIDTGTRYLLQAAPPPPPDARHLLDLGCGYGPIAVALAVRSPTATVWATEVNRRAVELCRSNAASAGFADRVRVELAPDDDHPLTSIPPDVTLDAIYTNPPIRIGKPKLHALLTAALERLRPGGHAYLVVHKHLGSDSLQRWMTGEGWPTERLGSRAGYRILEVQAPTGPLARPAHSSSDDVLRDRARDL